MRVGIDIGGTKIAGAMMDARGRVVAEARRPSPRGDYRGTLEAIADLVAGLSREAGVAAGRVGVGVPGNVDRAAGTLRLGNAAWLSGAPFRDDLAATLDLPVRLANDADCFALSEAVDGAGAGAQSVFGVILGTGVGGGFVVGGRLNAGPVGIAGEWGHAPMPRGTAEELAAGPCSCGRHGCIETLLSGPSFRRDHALGCGIAPDEAPQPEEITAAAAEGDPAAAAALGRYVERLGRALALLVNVLEPDVIVLGGGMSNTTALYAAVSERMLPHVFGGRCATRVLRNVHGDSSGVRGAARLWSEEETPE